jgi:predicted nucleic acid-binding protein
MRERGRRCRDAVVGSPVPGEVHDARLRGRIPVAVDAAPRTTPALESGLRIATDLELFTSAWSLRAQQTGFQGWGRVIPGSAIRAGCRDRLSEHFQHGREVEGIPIVDPFRMGPVTIMADH